MKVLKIMTAVYAAVKSVWTRGSPFAAFSALWPTNPEGKYVIQAEGIRLALTNHGVAPANLWINNSRGEEIDIILGLDDAAGYRSLPFNPFLNGVIGRYAGFMTGAGYTHDDARVQLQANAHNGTALFNGGEHGWGRTTWDVAVHINNSITFVLFDRMWNGFPGIFAACLTHTVTPYEWQVAFGVTPLIKAAPLDLSQEVFFNLDGFRSRGTRTVLDHTLHLPSAGMRFEHDELGLATGNMLSNRKAREFDFWSSPARTVGDALRQGPELPRHCLREGGRGCGYDEIFLLSHEDTGRKDERPVAVLSSPHSGVTMSLFTDRDALHVHTWNQKDGTVALKKTQGRGNVPQHGAISLEMRDWPDAVNHPEWTNRRTMWGMDGLYTSFATYKFSVKR